MHTYQVKVDDRILNTIKEDSKAKAQKKAEEYAQRWHVHYLDTNRKVTYVYVSGR